MKRDETFVHVAIRKYLKAQGWILVAGQYPGGSDDELHTLSIPDPEIAKDQSPDHRRHGHRKLVPDLIAYKEGRLLIVEAKPEHSTDDQEKLEYLLSIRRQDFLANLEKFARERGFQALLPVENLELIPVLAHLQELGPSKDSELVRLVVEDLRTVHLHEPA